MKLKIMIDASNKDFYSAVYAGKEAHNLAHKGTYCDAVNEALDFWGLSINDVNVVVSEELENIQFFNDENIGRDTGFFHIEFSNDKSLQCCLVESKKQAGLFNKQIESTNMATDWGLCGDCNSWFGDDIEIIDNVLLTAAKKYAVKII